MTQTVDARSIRAGSEREFIVEVARQILPVDIAFGEGDPALCGSITDLRALRITRFTSNGVAVGRTGRLARDDFRPSLMLGLQVSGSALVVQDGREVVV